MAKDKKSFILYADMISIIEKLPDESAGQLFKIVLRYVNDMNPVIDDLLLQIAFEPIKLQLKRDLKDWESKLTKRSESGKLGGVNSGKARSKTKQNEAKRSNASNNEAKGSTASKNEANEAVTDTVNVTVTVNDNVIEKECIRGNVFLHRKEIEKLQTQYSDEDLNWIYDKLSAYKLSNGKKYKSDYGAITNWVIDRLKEEKLKEKNSAKKENGNTESKYQRTVNAATELAAKRGFITPVDS